MNENEQNRKHFTMRQRALATYDYTTLWLHPWNDDRITYFMKTVLTAIYIYDGDLEKSKLVAAMYKQLNQRLGLPLTKVEQAKTIALIPQHLGSKL